MFGRLVRNLHRLLPLSLTSAHLFNQSPIKLETVSDNLSSTTVSKNIPGRSIKNDPRIKFVRDLADYVETQSSKDKAIIFYEMRGDEFIDNQVIALAQQFNSKHANKLSQNYEFVFLQSNSESIDDEERYLLLYGPNGQKVFNIDGYINKNRQKPYISINSQPLMKRLVEGLNVFRELNLENVRQELDVINKSECYTALFTLANSQSQVKQAKTNLQSFLKDNQVKSKSLNRFIVADEQTQIILGAKTHDNTQKNSIYLLIPDSCNLRREFKQKASFYSIHGKKYTCIDARSNMDQIFIFPPIQKKLKPDEMVLNVYINKNKDSGSLQSKIYEQLSKKQYAQYSKSLFYNGQVQNAAITLEMNDYSQKSLNAYQKNTKLTKEQIKSLLFNTYQWNFNIKSEGDINTPNILKWLEQSKGSNKLETQFYKSQKLSPVYAQQITGEQYKAIRDAPFDKIIYHYSHHCHGCKKFGGKFEQFAMNRIANTPNIHFYRINNDNNKSENVRNYNTTPVFVFYKKHYTNPFIYRMPIFTESLFESFIKITSEVSLIQPNILKNHIDAHNQAEHLVKQLVSKIPV